MRQLDERAVHVLAAALKEIPLLENGDRRADLVHSIREAPGVVEFEVTFDNATHTHLTRITRSCIQHSNAPAARRALYEEARRLAGGQRAVSWLRFFNAVLDSRHTDAFKEWLLENGGLLLTQGWGSSTAPGIPDPLSEFTWLVVGGSQAQIREFCDGIPGLPGSITVVIAPAGGEQPAEREHEEPATGSRRRWWLVGGVAAAAVLAAVIWAVVPAGDDRPTVSEQVPWDTAMLSLDSGDGKKVAAATVDVPAGSTRLVLALNLSDPNPGGGACPKTTVDVTIGDQTLPDLPLDYVVQTSVPKGRTSLTLKLTLNTPDHCKLLINTGTVDFKG
ncbi:hypothetical protein PUR71_16905 [Streptomyces sp. SP17BM10]|uniref:hypothetical protein n=1 Tax=Streptomyces sp. SP17BM10 TaxID=3002530 RepID=UPI002E78FA0D|nr:hypothetical protein [Streptomyces sp. SP17BM10]MEE1784568.1 hypothetical protein [Streptomyces sp. SP17BM10]